MATGSAETTANMLGALALVLTDDIREMTSSVLGRGGETVAALVTVGSNAAMTGSQLAMALDISLPSTSRLLDRLETESLIERTPVENDRRSMYVRLTPQGKKMRDKILRIRGAIVGNAIAHVSTEDMETLDRILRSILLRMTTSEARAYAFCRLCHEEICVPMNCPVEERCIEHEAART